MTAFLVSVCLAFSGTTVLEKAQGDGAEIHETDVTALPERAAAASYGDGCFRTEGEVRLSRPTVLSGGASARPICWAAPGETDGTVDNGGTADNGGTDTGSGSQGNSRGNESGSGQSRSADNKLQTPRPQATGKRPVWNRAKSGGRNYGEETGDLQKGPGNGGPAASADNGQKDGVPKGPGSDNNKTIGKEGVPLSAGAVKSAFPVIPIIIIAAVLLGGGAAAAAFLSRRKEEE